MFERLGSPLALVLPLIAVAAISCADNPGAVPTASTPRVLKATNPLMSQFQIQHPGQPTLDDRFGLVSGAVPGFGGMYLDNGRPTIYLTDTTMREAAYEALTTEFPGAPELELPITVKKGDYDYLQLILWYKKFRNLIASTAPAHGVEWTDIRESKNRIEVSLRSEAAEAPLRAAARSLGIPDGALALTYDSRPMSLASSDSMLSSVWRPVLGSAYVGIAFADSGGAGTGCTLGFNAYRGSAYSWSLTADTDYAFTASHCTSWSGTYAADTMYQPLPSYGPVAVEVANPPFLTPAENPDCPSGKVCRYSDAAAFEYVDSAANGPIQDYLRVLPYAHGYEVAGNPDSVATPDWFEQRERDTTYFEGGSAHKTGATTGDTWGFVNHTCTDYYGDTGDRMPSNGVFLCEAGVDSTADVDHGDSGGTVFMWTADYGGAHDTYLLGLLSSGAPESGFLFSTMAGIRADFGWSDLHTAVIRF